MNNNLLVSIVVPIYNVEKYLSKCIESILNQSYKNLDIILVNDGSQDNSVMIANEKAQKDKRIQIINQENKGLSAARNAGIKAAKGEYICFVDSDDFIDSEYIKKLLENSLKNNADISACDFYYINEQNKTWNNKKKEYCIYNNKEAIKDIFIGDQNTEVIICNKLYKIKLFKDNNIIFPEGKLHEDNFTTYKLYYYANKIVLSPEKLYFYLQRPNSITTKKFNKKRLDTLEVLDEARSFFKKQKMDLNEEIECYEIIMKIGIINNMIRDKFEGEEKDKIIKDVIKHKKQYLKNRYIQKKFKIALYLLNGKGKIYQLVYNKLNNK